MLAQVRPAQAGAAVTRWWLDFPVDLLPYESAIYELQYGPVVTPGPCLKQGHKLIQRADEFRIANDPHIVWTVSRDLAGLLSSVRAGELEYLRVGISSGLQLCDRDGRQRAIGGSGSRPTVNVTRDGPLAVGLRFEFRETLPGTRSTVDLTFPVFKSWVEVDWRIDDPLRRVAGARAGLNVNLDPPLQVPTLVDFGTTGLVYLSLGPGQESQLQAGAGAWQVLRGRSGRLEPFVAGPKQPGLHAPPEGWTHVMDRRRCLAAAVDDFAVGGNDHLSVSADGHVELRRSFSATRTSAARRLRFWLHFVPFPPQETAATSPQAMQNPVIARVRIAGASETAR